MRINPRQLAYRMDPVAWVEDVLKITPETWQQQFLREPDGASILVLTARQVGKTTVAAMAIAHAMTFQPGCLCVIACPAHRQSAEAVRHVKKMLVHAGAKLVSDNVFGLEIENGSRVLALPGSDSSIRGLTVDAWIIVDEAAQATHELIAALRPMRARCPQTRLAMLSTAWTRIDPFWTAWSGDDDSWTRIEVTGEAAGHRPEFLEQERRNLGQQKFNQEYMGIPSGGASSLFGWDLYEAAANVTAPLIPPGRAFSPAVQQPTPLPNPFASLRMYGVVP